MSSKEIKTCGSLPQISYWIRSKDSLIYLATVRLESFRSVSIPAAAEERVVKATKIQSQEVKSAAASELPGEVRSNTILPIPGGE